MGVAQPLMVLKSDGGVLPAEMVFARPLNCLLSGPAAGAAAALHFAGITFGLFFEVGGTSTDISFIHNGRIRYRPARVGGHRLQAETLDLRTVALGGGSMLGVGAHGGIALGPRSAHLAGLGYLSFAPDAALQSGKVELHTPEGSHREYFVWRAADGSRCAFTLTDLANANGLIPPDDPAYAPKEKLQPAFAALERKRGLSLAQLTEAVGAQIERTVAPVVAEYLRSFRLERSLLRLVGGGGGVNSALPFIAARLKLPYEVVEHYPYISALGAAIAAGTVQVKIPSASGGVEDLQRARGLASDELRQAGMDPARAHYEYAFDATAGVLHLTATAERPWESQGAEVAEDALAARASELTRAEDTKLVFSNAGFAAYEASTRGGFRARKHLAVLDRRGKARLIRPDAAWEIAPSADELLPLLTRLHRDRREFRDAGEVPPQLWVVGEAVHDLSSLPDSGSFAEVLAAEVSVPGPKLVVISSPAV
jgi:N-methylhydantoinase A